MQIDTPTKRLPAQSSARTILEKLQQYGYLGYRRIEDGGTWVARWRDEEASTITAP